MFETGLLQIFALGDLRILVDGEKVRGLRSRKALAILIYLAATGESQAREVLAGLFWSESSQAQAMSNLRDALSSLRKHLTPFINIDRYSVSLNQEANCWFDVSELELVIANMRRDQEHMDVKTVEDLEIVLGYYQRDFLEGFYIRGARGFEEWQVIVRERIRMEALNAFFELTNFYCNAGNFKKGISFARRALEIEPLMEEGHQQLIRLLDYSGRSSEALIQYEKCREILSDELSVEPSDETKKLLAYLLEGEKIPGLPVSQFMHNLSLPLPELIGREEDLSQIGLHMKDPNCRLLTLTGVGGIGKTSLGCHAAAAALDTFPDGVWLVELAAFNETDLLPDHIAAVFGVSAQEDKVGRGITGILVDFLKDKNLLLVLDNCEHLIEPCAFFVKVIINGCPQVKILITSRETVGIPREQIYQVFPLAIPPESIKSQDIHEYAAIRLFVERATGNRPRFGITTENMEVLADICRQLDGIPLAIELAAARVKVLSLNQIAERLLDRFQILTGGPRTALPRHQTLQATMDWSYNFLSKGEQAMLRRLSIFSGGWTIQGAEEVACFGEVAKPQVLDTLTHLVDKSLVSVEDKGEVMRYGILETVRQYGVIKLSEENETDKTRQRHAHFYAQQAEKADEGLRDHRQHNSMGQLDTEHDNLRSALGWSIDHNEANLAFRLVGALGWYWFMRGHWKESRRWLAKVLELKSDGNQGYRAKAICRAGGLELIRGNLVGSVERIEEAEAICRDSEDKEGLAWCLNLLGQGRTWKRADFKLAGPLLAESIDLFQSLENDWGAAWSLRYLGQVFELQGEYERGQAMMKEGFHSFEEIGDMWNAAHSAYLLGTSAFRHGDFKVAKMTYEICLEKCELVEDRVMEAHALRGLAQLALKLDDNPRAELMLYNALEALQKIGDDNCIAVAKRDLAELKQRQGDFGQSAELLHQSLQTYVKLGYEDGQIWVIERFAALAVYMELGVRAARLLAVGGGHLGDGAVQLSPTFKEEHGELVSAAQKLIGKQAYEKYFSEGATMSLQEAVEYALEGQLTD